MSSKYDQLAGRLTERLTTSPARGQATRRDDDAPSTAGTSDSRFEAPRSRRQADSPAADHRPGATVRRGHLVPDELHRRARRRKDGGGDRKATWSEVLVAGVTMLVEHPDPRSISRARVRDDGPTRLVQATLPIELDRRLRECYLDLDDRSSPVTYEQLWAAAIALWLGD